LLIRSFNDIETITSECDVKLEVQHMKHISEFFVRKFLDTCKQNKKTVLNEKQEAFEKIYQFLQLQETRIITLMIYNVMSEEVYLIIKNIIQDGKSVKEFEVQLASIAHLSKLISKKVNKKKSDMEITISVLQKRFYFAKDFSAYLNDIYLNYIATFKDEIKDLTTANHFKDDINMVNSTLSKEAPGSLLYKQLNSLPERKINHQYTNKSDDISHAQEMTFTYTINTEETLIL
jgi:hypothetical protein